MGDRLWAGKPSRYAGCLQN